MSGEEFNERGHGDRNGRLGSDEDVSEDRTVRRTDV